MSNNDKGSSPKIKLIVGLGNPEKNLLKTSNFNPSPNYYGYITGGGNQIGIISEFLKSALNQNNLKWHSAPRNKCYNYVGAIKKCFPSRN